MSNAKIKIVGLKVAALLIASVLIAVGSAFFSTPEMFQRSGAILTIASAWSFLWVEQVKGMAELGDASCESGEFATIRESWRKQAALMARFCAAFGAVGTMIWGYGDLIVDFL